MGRRVIEGDFLSRPDHGGLSLGATKPDTHSPLLLLIHHPILITTVVSTPAVSPVLVHHPVLTLTLDISTQEIVRIRISTEETLPLLAHGILTVVHSTLAKRSASTESTSA